MREGQILVRKSLEVPSALFNYLEPLLVNKLECITLKSIALDSSSAEALSHSLQSQYCSLVTLKLSYCHLLSNASKKLALGIGRNVSLHRIYFHDCQLDSADFRVLAYIVKDNKTPKEVRIWQFRVAAMIGKVEIQALKQSNQNITFVLKL